MWRQLVRNTGAIECPVICLNKFRGNYVKSNSFCPNDNLDTSYIFSTNLKVVLVIRLARYCLSPLLYPVSSPLLVCSPVQSRNWCTLPSHKLLLCNLLNHVFNATIELRHAIKLHFIVSLKPYQWQYLKAISMNFVDNIAKKITIDVKMVLSQWSFCANHNLRYTILITLCVLNWVKSVSMCNKWY